MFARLIMFGFIVFFAHNALAYEKPAIGRDRHQEEAPHSSRL